MAMIANLLMSILGRLIGEEISAWTPKLCQGLVSLAIKCLPTSRRERYGEEWRSHLDQLPGTFAKIVAAFGFIPAALTMRESRESENRIDVWHRTDLLLHELDGKAVDIMNLIVDDPVLSTNENLEPPVERLRARVLEARARVKEVHAAMDRFGEHFQFLLRKDNTRWTLRDDLFYSRTMRTLQVGFDRLSVQAREIEKMTTDLSTMLQEMSSRRESPPS